MVSLMKHVHLTLSIVGLIVLGCAGSKSSAPTPDGGTDAVLDGGTPIPTSGLRAHVITDVSQASSGDMSGGRVGDVLIANDQIRFVVRTGQEGITLHGLAGGCVIDADNGESDQLQELAPIVGFNSLITADVAVTQDGDSGVAEVTVTGTAGLVDILATLFPAAALEVPMTVIYRLTSDSRSLEIELSVESDTPQLMGDVMLTGGDLQFQATGGFLAGEGSKVSYAIVTQDPLTTESFGGITLVLGPNVPPPVIWRQWLVVGDGSLSSVVDEALKLRGQPHGSVSGTVNDPDATIEATDADGQVVSRFRATAEGVFSGLLPVGVFDLTATGPGRVPGASFPVEVADGQSVADVELSVEAPGTLVVTTDLPIRVTLIAEGGGQQIQSLEVGTTTLPIAPGAYTVHASRGYEYEPDTTTMTAIAGESVSWSPTVVRSVDTAGWVASDFHLHSEWSTDSAVPLRDRILSCAAEGVEYAVATDHDMVTDYESAFPESLAGLIVVASGVEASTLSKGHFCVWPFTPDPSKVGRGAPRWFGKDFGELMEAFGAGQPGRVIQVNHPRSGSAAFSALGYEPSAPDPELLALFTFNAVEVHNGGHADFEQGLIDWLSLVGEGLPIAATGVSDSHNLGAYCGHARTYVEVADDDPATLVRTDVDAAVLAGRTMVSSGPFVVAQKGQTAGSVHVRVAAPSWMDVDSLTLYTDAGIDQEIALEPSDGSTTRFDDDIVLNFAAAEFVTVVVRGDQSSPPFGHKEPAAVSALVTF